MGQWSDCLRNSEPRPEDTGSSSSSSEPDSGPSQPKTDELEGYIKGAIMKEFRDFPESIFRPSSNPPALRRGVVNHILIYRGSFNPPHVGHRTVLAHCFLRSSFEHMVAAIIVPQDVDGVREKMEQANEAEGTVAMVLSRTQRGKLWQDDTLMQWTWVYTYRQQFKKWREKLLGLVSDAGFKLVFVVLAGGETAPRFIAEEFRSGKPLSNFIFSDPMRTIDSFDADETPRPEQGYGKWEKNARGEEQLLEKIAKGNIRASEALGLLYPQQTRLVEGLLIDGEGLVKPALQHLQHLLQLSGSSIVCIAKSSGKARLQYAPARNVTCAKGMPSSTLVRRLIRETAPGERLEAIGDIALNVKILLEFVDDDPPARKAMSEL